VKALWRWPRALLARQAAPRPHSGGGRFTVQTYDVVHYPQAGWGQFLACGLKPGAVVINRAIGGRSTKSFIAEGRWDRLMAEIKPAIRC
jgi:lysophospholipase L1-like esterase